MEYNKIDDSTRVLTIFDDKSTVWGSHIETRRYYYIQKKRKFWIFNFWSNIYQTDFYSEIYGGPKDYKEAYAYYLKNRSRIKSR